MRVAWRSWLTTIWRCAKAGPCGGPSPSAANAAFDASHSLKATPTLAPVMQTTSVRQYGLDRSDASIG
jgi:hypothetical protein